MKKPDPKAVQPPYLADLIPTALSPEDLSDGFVVSSAEITRADLTSISTLGLKFDRVQFSKTRLDQSEFKNAKFSDVKSTDCELSCLISVGASFFRTEWHLCRFTGWQTYDSVFEHCRFEECKMDLANFRLARFKNCLFKSCVLKGADFSGAQFSNVRMEGCKLAEAEFRQAIVESLDLRGSEVGQLRYADGLRGATIDVLQMMDLAPRMAEALGIEVLD